MLEQFARLNAGTQTMMSSGNKPLLDKSDLCSVLAKLGEQHSWYVYAMIDQRRSYNMQLLHIYFKQHVLQVMRERKYKSRVAEPSYLAEGITRATIYTHFHPKGKCGKCNGLGRVGTSRCKNCDGSGNKSYSHVDKIRYGFPFSDKISRKFYERQCVFYENLINGILLELQDDLRRELRKLKIIEKAYRRDENTINEALFDEL